MKNSNIKIHVYGDEKYIPNLTQISYIKAYDDRYFFEKVEVFKLDSLDIEKLMFIEKGHMIIFLYEDECYLFNYHFSLLN